MFRPTVSMLMRPTSRAMIRATKPMQATAHHVGSPIKNWIKSVPVEVYPLAVIMTCSTCFGTYIMAKTLTHDSQLRLRRQAHH